MIDRCPELAIPAEYAESCRKRFLAKIEKMGSGCWHWTAGTFQGEYLQYGAFWLKHRKASVHAHRAAYALFVADVPENLFVLHRCNNDKCVNPDHLYLGDHMQNMRDRDDCGHTSKGEHRYNFKRRPELVEQVHALFDQGLKIQEIMQQLGIGWGTYWRCIGKKRRNACKTMEAA